MGWRKGENILTAEPFAHVLSSRYRGIRCDACLQSCPNLKKCTACGLLKYCNTNCQRKDWQIHKFECRCLRQVTPKVPTESVRLLLRIIIRIQHGDETKIMESVKWRSFSDLQSHVKEILQDEKRSKIFSEMTFTLKELVAGQIDLPTEETLLEIYGKMVINTYSICDGEMQPIGSGLYLSPSLLDHSCVPNAVAVFTGTSLSIRCVSDITSSDPRQIFVSYIDQLAPSMERQTQLEEQYYFTCSCLRCRDSELDNKMLSLCCSKRSCTGLLCPDDTGKGYLPCKLCGTLVNDEEYVAQCQRVVEESRDGILKLDDLKKNGDPEVRLQFCKELIKKQEVLSKFNVYRVKTLDRAMDACIDAGLWQEAVEYGSQTVKAYRTLHPPNTPTVGIQLMKLGKLQLYLQQLLAGCVSLNQAESILAVTHGQSHEVYKELAELMDQCAEQRRMVLEQAEES